MLDADGQPTNLTDADIARICMALSTAWADTTLETYGSGLLVFHVFCDRKNISKAQCAPVSPIIMASFVATLISSYSASTISNYIHGIHAWHILHGSTWSLNHAEMDTLLQAAQHSAPPTSCQPKHLLYTPAYISTLREHLNLSTPLHSAVFACLTTTFYTAARLSKFTVPNLQSFNPAIHVKPSNISLKHDRNGLATTVFHLPHTKISRNSEDVFWAKQNGCTNPEAAWHNHLRINQPPLHGHLFMYHHGPQGKYWPLTKLAFLTTLSATAKHASLPPLTGHSIRIGATLEYLLRGVPFDVMKAKGHWASDAFTIYLTKHAQVMAPYMQAIPEIHSAAVRYMMPPVH